MARRGGAAFKLECGVTAGRAAPLEVPHFVPLVNTVLCTGLSCLFGGVWGPTEPGRSQPNGLTVPVPPKGIRDGRYRQKGLSASPGTPQLPSRVPSEARDVASLRGLGCCWGLCPSPRPQGGAAAPPVSHLPLRLELAEPGDWETPLLGNQVYCSWALRAEDGGHVSPVPTPVPSA